MKWAMACKVFGVLTAIATPVLVLNITTQDFYPASFGVHSLGFAIGALLLGTALISFAVGVALDRLDELTSTDQSEVTRRVNTLVQQQSEIKTMLEKIHVMEVDSQRRLKDLAKYPAPIIPHE